MDFKQRFGLDYLTSSSAGTKSRSDATDPATGTLGWNPTTTPTLPQGLNDAVVSYSAKVIDALYRDQRKTMQLFDIAKEVSARVDTLLPVMTFLSANGYVKKEIQDPLGNDTFRLTDAGTSIAPQTK